MITADDILTTSGRHAGRMRWVSPAVRDNAVDLAARVSRLLAGYQKKVTVRSGFRDPDSNRAAGGAPHSRHMTGQAVDLADDDRKIVAFITPALLEQHGLYMEAPGSTPTWCHLQSTPPPSGRRIFNP